MEKIEKMCLVEATPIEFKDKNNPALIIKKWKYTFFMPDNSLFTGFLDNDKLKNKVKKIGKYDDKLAENFKLFGKVFQGEIKWKLSPEA